MVLVASLWHTGTWFTFDLIPLPFSHKRQQHLNEIDALPQCKTIVPLRHPDAVATSWASRGLDLKELERQWKRMTQIQDVFFFPIDAKDRDARLAALSHWLDMPLHTDWHPMNSRAMPSKAARINVDPEFTQRFW